MKILLYYYSTDGHTLKICQAISKLLEENENQVDIINSDTNSNPDLLAYDKLIIGASIRHGKHSQDLLAFIQKNQPVLDTKPNAFFSVNLVARKPGKNTAEGNPYVRKFLSKITWKPQNIAVFAGKLEYPKYRLFDRLMIQLIMKITKGPTDVKKTYEFTNWEEVNIFAQHMAQSHKNKRNV